MASAARPIPDGLRLVTASGVCGFCDCWFRDEEVLAYDSSAFPDGVGYIHVRHLDDPAFDELWGPSEPVRSSEDRGRGLASQ